MHNTKQYTIFVILNHLSNIFLHSVKKRMKKLVAVILMLVAFVGSEALAIGLPNNAYVQRHATLVASKEGENIKLVHGKTENLLTSQVKQGYASEQSSTIGSHSDLKEFSQAIVSRVVSFISMILLSLSSFGSSLADQVQIIHSLVITDLPPQV